MSMLIRCLFVTLALIALAAAISNLLRSDDGWVGWIIASIAAALGVGFEAALDQRRRNLAAQAAALERLRAAARELRDDMLDIAAISARAAQNAVQFSEALS